MSILQKVLAFGGLGGAGIAAGVFLVTFLGFSGGQLQTYSVKLEPDGVNGGTLEVVKSNKCNQGKEYKGCLRFKEDKAGLVRFYLPGSKYNFKKCKVNGGPSEVITKIELTATGIAKGADADTGVFAPPMNNPAQQWLKNEAFPSLDMTTGILYEATLANAGTQAWMLNMNSNPAGIVKSFWYKVTATKCGDPATTWVTDPRGDNEGHN